MPEGEVMIADLGLVLGAARPGEGEGEPPSKGLLRHRALPGPVVDMLPLSLSLSLSLPNQQKIKRPVKACYYQFGKEINMLPVL